MTDQQTPGYRGALPPRNDSLTRPWIAIVLLIFILMFVLAAANVPSRLFSGASTPTPVPSASGSVVASASVAPSASVAASGSAAASVSAAASQ